MERYIREITLNVSKLDQRHIKLLLVILALTLFVLGAGAPGDMGGFGG